MYIEVPAPRFCTWPCKVELKGRILSTGVSAAILRVTCNSGTKRDDLPCQN